MRAASGLRFLSLAAGQEGSVLSLREAGTYTFDATW